MAENRTLRETATRELTQRPKSWSPADLLPEPTRQDGWEYRWIRKSMSGVSDPTNVSKSLREGWEPCRLEDHPELKLAVDKDAVASGMVEVGGLILCKLPSEMWSQREKYYSSQASEQMESVDAQLDRENDPRMPMFRDRQSKVTFGNGR